MSFITLSIHTTTGRPIGLQAISFHLHILLMSLLIIEVWKVDIKKIYEYRSHEY
jgi:hypothetical protein